MAFLEQEKVESLRHFRETASVASCRRALVAFPPRIDPDKEKQADRIAESLGLKPAPHWGDGTTPCNVEDDGFVTMGPAHANRIEDIRPEHLALIADDPINPRHYGGTACAEIGERLTANCYQILKYVWRLGEKDDPCIELGKAIWYLDREINLGLPASRGERLHPRGLKREKVVELTTGRSPLTQTIALMLWDMCYGIGTTAVSWAEHTKAVHDELTANKRVFECADRGRGLEP
jgi:hypothetical protein